jgi:hypothetical protein
MGSAMAAMERLLATTTAGTVLAMAYTAMAHHTNKMASMVLDS